MTEKEKDAKTYNEGYYAGQKSVVETDYRLELRDQLAIATLTGLLASTKANPYNDHKDLVETAWVIADAMLVEREKGAKP